MQKPIRTVDPSRKARVVVVLIWAWFAFDVLYGLASLDTIVVLGGLGGSIAPQDRLQLSDDIGAAAGLAFVVVDVIAGAAILRWIYIVNRNAHALGGRMTTSPGWTVFWFFVPIVCLWKPFAGVRESWQATLNPSAPESVRVPVVMRYWWGAWIVSNNLGMLSGRMARSGTAAAVMQSNWLSVATLPLDLMLTLTLITVVRRLSRLQTAALARSGATRPADDASEAAPLPSSVPSESPV